MASRELNNKQILKEILPHASDIVIDEMLKYSHSEALNQEAFNAAVNQCIGFPCCSVAKAIVEFTHNRGNNNLYYSYIHIAEDNGYDIEISYNESRPKGWILSILKDGVEESCPTWLMIGHKSTKRLTCYSSYIKAQKEMIHQTVYELSHILDKVEK